MQGEEVVFGGKGLHGSETHVFAHERAREAAVGMIRLRPHHVLCVLTFAGEGYSPEFVVNFRAILERIAAGESVTLAEGPDDICAPLAGSGDEHCTADSVRRRDREALLALAAGGHLGTGGRTLRLDAAALAALRARFAEGTLRGACRGCSWWSLCTDIAAGRFARAQL